MPKFPVVSALQLVDFFTEHGFQKVRQKGSHIIMRKSGKRTVVISKRKDAGIDVIQNNLRTAGISKKEFIAAMQNKRKTKNPKK